VTAYFYKHIKVCQQMKTLFSSDLSHLCQRYSVFLFQG